MALPDLDAPAGETFSFRELCECAETWIRLRPDNTPRQAETYEAMTALGRAVLDPVTRRFGRPVLTYGFCGPALAAAAKPPIAPRLDQHAGHERNSRGAPICPRLGQAADFIVPGVSSHALARFVIENTPFDRLYFYGSDRPVHVSHGPDHTRQVVVMARAAERWLPRVVTGERLRAWLQASDATSL